MCLRDTSQMSAQPRPYFTILGVSPFKKGFGFAVIEPRGLLVSWGVVRLYTKRDDEVLQRLQSLVDKHRSQVVCLEDLDEQPHRAGRARRTFDLMTAAARSWRISTSRISLRSLCEQSGTSQRSRKREIALRLVEAYPELGDSLPPPRRPWQSQDERMSLFVAGAVAVAYLPLLRDAA